MGETDKINIYWDSFFLEQHFEFCLCGDLMTMIMIKP